MLDTTDEEELLRRRCVLLDGPIDDAAATQAIAKMLYLQYQNPQSPLTLIIDSPGGAVSASLAMLDTIDAMSLPVYTTCTGDASGSAVNLLAHGARSFRRAVRDAQIQLVPIWSPVHSSKAELEIEKDRRVLIDYLVRDTGRSAEEIAINMDRSTVLNADQAIEFGLIDQIV